MNMKNLKFCLYSCTVIIISTVYAQYASPDPNSPFYDRQGNQISIGQAMDQGGTVRMQEVPAKRSKENTAKLFANGWKLLREMLPKECKDCSEWHEGKKRKLKTCLELYELSLKAQDEMWDSMHDALDIKCLTMIIAGMSPLPGTSLAVGAGFDGALPSADSAAYEVTADVVTGKGEEYVDKKINNYRKISNANKNAKTAKNAAKWNNAGKAFPYVAAGMAVLDYGFEMQEWEDKIKEIEEGNKVVLNAIRNLQGLRCPECGDL